MNGTRNLQANCSYELLHTYKLSIVWFKCSSLAFWLLKLLRLMAVWIASYPDGSWKQRLNKVRHSHRLLPEAWLIDKLERAGGSDTASTVLSSLRRDNGMEESAFIGGVVVRGLAKCERTPAGEHSRGWASNFNNEAMLMMRYLSGSLLLPGDFYTLTASQFRACDSTITLGNCIGTEQYAVGRRSAANAERSSSKPKPYTLNNRLKLGYWDDSKSFQFRRASEHWRWYGGPAMDDAPAFLSSSDDDDDANVASEDHMGRDFGTLSSDSESEERLISGAASDILRAWGITCDAKDLPILFLPDSVAFLLSRKVWKHLAFRTEWHKSLIDRHAKFPCAHTFLFPHIVCRLFKKLLGRSIIQKTILRTCQCSALKSCSCCRRICGLGLQPYCHGLRIQSSVNVLKPA